MTLNSTNSNIDKYSVHRNKMKKFLKITLLMLLEIIPSEQGEVSTDALEGSNRVLSRRKRFLIFPEGSSFQFGMLRAQ